MTSWTTSAGGGRLGSRCRKGRGQIITAEFVGGVGNRAVQLSDSTASQQVTVGSRMDVWIPMTLGFSTRLAQHHRPHDLAYACVATSTLASAQCAVTMGIYDEATSGLKKSEGTARMTYCGTSLPYGLLEGPFSRRWTVVDLG